MNSVSYFFYGFQETEFKYVVARLNAKSFESVEPNKCNDQSLMFRTLLRQVGDEEGIVATYIYCHWESMSPEAI